MYIDQILGKAYYSTILLCFCYAFQAKNADPFRPCSAFLITPWGNAAALPVRLAHSVPPKIKKDYSAGKGDGSATYSCLSN